MNREAFNYLVVITGIILGLGITQILACLADLIVQRERIKFYWPHLVWLSLLFLIFVQYWFNFYGWSSIEYNFSSFVSSLVFPLGAYLSSAIMSISLPESGTIDLKRYYYSHSRWSFGISGFSLAYLLVHDQLILEESLSFSLPTVIRIGVVICLILLSSQKRESIHKGTLGVLVGALFLFLFLTPYSPQ